METPLRVPSPTLILAGGLATAAAVALGAIGHSVSRRSVSAEGRAARIAASVWWYAAASFLLEEGLLNAAAGIGITDLALFSTFRQVSILAMCAALGGLTIYLAYLVAGKNRGGTAAWMGYAWLALVLLYHVNASEPTGLDVGAWSAEIRYAKPLEGPLLLAAYGLAFAPPTLLALALLARSRDGLSRSERARVGSLSFGLFAFAIIGAAFATGLTGWLEIALGAGGSLAVAAFWLAFLRRRDTPTAQDAVE